MYIANNIQHILNRIADFINVIVLEDKCNNFDNFHINVLKVSNSVSWRAVPANQASYAMRSSYTGLDERKSKDTKEKAVIPDENLPRSKETYSCVFKQDHK